MILSTINIVLFSKFNIEAFGFFNLAENMPLTGRCIAIHHTTLKA